MDPFEVLDLFDRLVGQTVVALNRLDDWGPSGGRSSQYQHDVVADEILAGGLRRAGLRVLSEESGLVGTGEVTVVVDPVDGSTNASMGLPWFAASLCAVDDDGPLASLVVNLATGDRYRAIRDQGARRDRMTMAVDRSPGRGPGAGVDRPDGGEVGGVAFADAAAIGPSGCRRLDEAIVAVSGWPDRSAGWRQFRVLGAAALDLCAVADGCLDGYADVGRAHGVWDYLGAWLVCREAGVDLVDWGGEELVVLDPDARRGPVAAATSGLTQELADQIRAWATTLDR